MWQDIAVIIPTFNRAKIVLNTVRSLMRFLDYPGVINYYVGIDGTDETPDLLREFEDDLVNIIEGPHKGLGANLNNLIRNTHEPMLFQLDDDHLLKARIDLAPHVKELYSNELAGWIRLMGIGSHNYTATLQGDYWYISWDSRELYIPSNRPHLKHRRFVDYYGPYLEGATLCQTEEAYCHQCRDKAKRFNNSIKVLVPLNSNSESAWDHVGRSWQEQGY